MKKILFPDHRRIPSSIAAAAVYVFVLCISAVCASWYTYFPYAEQLRGHYYFLYYDGVGLDWDGARAACIADSGYLASADDDIEFNLLRVQTHT